MVAVSLAVWPWAGPLYGAVAIVAGRGVPVRGAPPAAPVARHGCRRNGGDGLVTMRLFHLSILYLTLVFAGVAAGAFIH